MFHKNYEIPVSIGDSKHLVGVTLTRDLTGLVRSIAIHQCDTFADGLNDVLRQISEGLNTTLINRDPATGEYVPKQI